MTPWFWKGVIAAWALAPPAMAQALPSPPPENVIVTAPRLPDAVIEDFVMSNATPSRMIDKLARWKEGICPVPAGLPVAVNRYVTRRIKEVAEIAGAPVQAMPDCPANIDIVFTTRPQALLDDIRTKHPTLLGYHDASDLKRIAILNHPIQAWYASETEDINGTRSIDDPMRNRGVLMAIPPSPQCMQCSAYLPSAREERVEATRLGDGLRSDLYHATVIVDWRAVDGDEIGPLADYIAMLALSQTASFDGCQSAPSITNLMSEGCDADKKPGALADIDLAYLRALYRVNPATTMQAQRSEIVSDMKKNLTGR